MSSDRSELLVNFMSIAGEGITESEAERYLEMGKYNLEAALNYFFNKKTKVEQKPKQPAPTNLFQKLQQGQKKQAHVERIIKKLRDDYSAPTVVPTKNLNTNNLNDTLKVSKTPNPALPQSSTMASQQSGAKSQQNSDVKSINKPEVATPKVNVNSSALSSEKIDREERKEDNNKKVEPVVRSDSERNKNKQEVDFFDSAQYMPSEESNKIEEDSNPFKSKESTEKDTQANRIMNLKINEVEEEEEEESKGVEKMDEEWLPNNNKSTKPEPKQQKLKRNFNDFAEFHGSSSTQQNKQPSPKEDRPNMQVENTIQDTGWPKYLGRMLAKAYIMSSFQLDMRINDEIQLRREKPKQVQTKKGFKTKPPVISSSSAMVRVLYKDEEIGKLETDFSHILAPLLDRNYIFVEATLNTEPATWSTFSAFWVNIDVYIAEAVISKPLTEIFAFKDNSKDEEDRMLQELQYTKDSFVALFDVLRLERITETLIKRLPPKYSKHLHEDKDAYDRKASNFAHQQQLKQDLDKSDSVNEEKKFDIFDPWNKAPQQKSLSMFVAKKPRVSDQGSTAEASVDKSNNADGNNTEQVIVEESSDVDYEKLLALENEDHTELKLSEPPESFASSLHVYQKQALTWMLSREGCNEKLYNRMNERNRIIHPLWEEYVLKDGAHLYFNPYTGQVAKDIPKAAPDCLGGILADEMGLGKTVMMISLLHAHKYNRQDTSIFKKQAEKRRKLNNVKGQASLSMVAKPNLKPAGTLIIMPVTLLAQWESEIELHSNNKAMKVFVYYGDRRSEGKGDLGRFDVVLTTYGILSNEAISNSEKEIYKYEWFRIVLDEAHYIKGRTIQTAKAVYELSGIHKWCLSGTPIQNKLDDMFSLIHFLKLEPWSDYVWWNTYINKPNEKGDPIVFQMLQTILRPILLRRTKKTQGKDGNLIVQLPDKVSKIEYIELTPEERDFYDSTFKRSKTEFDKFVAEGTLVSHYAHVFELLLRLRQICDHPFLVFSNPDVKGKESLEEEIRKFIKKNEDKDKEEGGSDDENDDKKANKVVQKKPSSDKDGENRYEVIMDENTRTEKLVAVNNSKAVFNQSFLKETIDKLKTGQLDNCVVCLSDIEDAVITVCSHVMCRYCLIRAIDMTSMCPICRTILTKKDFMTVPRESRFSLDIEKKYHRSSKIEALLRYINGVIERNEKCVVFSQFISMLMLVEHDLKLNNIKFVRLDGSLAQKKRAEVLEEFKTNPTIHVFLISLKAGGVGLNLVVANNAFLIDPWWNPAVEEQAVERCHRIGQKKAVQVVRFICKETVEERIVELHSYKKELFDSTITFNQEERKALNAENFKYLMQTYHH